MCSEARRTCYFQTPRRDIDSFRWKWKVFFSSPLLFTGAWLVLTTQPNVKRAVAAAAAAAEIPAEITRSRGQNGKLLLASCGQDRP